LERENEMKIFKTQTSGLKKKHEYSLFTNIFGILLLLLLLLLQYSTQQSTSLEADRFSASL